MNTNLAALEHDLQAAFERFAESRRRRRRTLRAAAVGLVVTAMLATVAVASTTDLQLDPTKWTILSRGGTDDGRAEFVNAEDKQTGGRSSFFLQHDADLGPYEAFRLYERNQAAAAAGGAIVPGEQGDVCSRVQLTRAEATALTTLRSSFAPGAKPDETMQAVDESVSAAFAGNACRGLGYAGERARFVFAGIEPESNLMPGAR